MSSRPPSPTTINDISNNHLDLSFNAPKIVNFTKNQVLDSSGVEIVNQQGTTQDGSFVINTTFTTVNPQDYDVNISEKTAEQKQRARLGPFAVLHETTYLFLERFFALFT